MVLRGVAPGSEILPVRVLEESKCADTDAVHRRLPGRPCCPSWQQATLSCQLPPGPPPSEGALDSLPGRPHGCLMEASLLSTGAARVGLPRCREGPGRGRPARQGTGPLLITGRSTPGAQAVLPWAAGAWRGARPSLNQGRSRGSPARLPSHRAVDVKVPTGLSAVVHSGSLSHLFLSEVPAGTWAAPFPCPLQALPGISSHIAACTSVLLSGLLLRELEPTHVVVEIQLDAGTRTLRPQCATRRPLCRALGSNHPRCCQGVNDCPKCRPCSCCVMP